MEKTTSTPNITFYTKFPVFIVSASYLCSSILRVSSRYWRSSSKLWQQEFNWIKNCCEGNKSSPFAKYYSTTAEQLIEPQKLRFLWWLTLHCRTYRRVPFLVQNQYRQDSPLIRTAGLIERKTNTQLKYCNLLLTINTANHKKKMQDNIVLSLLWDFHLIFLEVDCWLLLNRRRFNELMNQIIIVYVVAVSNPTIKNWTHVSLLSKFGCFLRMIESQHVCFSKQDNVSYRKEIKTPLQRDFQISLPPSPPEKAILTDRKFNFALKKAVCWKKVDFFIITLTNTTTKVDVLQETLQTVAKNFSMKSSFDFSSQFGKISPRNHYESGEMLHVVSDEERK